jgi:hypothetical protein
MPEPIRFTNWIFDHLLWDTAGTARQGLLRVLWATRKILIAIVGSAVMTWWFWIEHHPSEIASVALIHFVFVMTLIALFVYVAQRLNSKKSPSKQ